MLIGMIWAQDRNRVIGSGTGMLWRVPADFAHFKATTWGHPVIMGRSSWEALGKALPGRHNIVLTSQTDYLASGAQTATDLQTAIDLARLQPGDTAWIVGGGQVYAQAMPLADLLVVTDLDLAVDGQVLAPEIDPDTWAVDPAGTDHDWRPVSGDARWKVTTYRNLRCKDRP